MCGCKSITHPITVISSLTCQCCSCCVTSHFGSVRLPTLSLSRAFARRHRLLHHGIASLHLLRLLRRHLSVRGFVCVIAAFCIGVGMAGVQLKQDFCCLPNPLCLESFLLSDRAGTSWSCSAWATWHRSPCSTSTRCCWPPSHRCWQGTHLPFFRLFAAAFRFAVCLASACLVCSAQVGNGRHQQLS